MNPLTEREREVLGLAMFTNRQIALVLGISVNTVKNHFTSIYEKLDISGNNPKRTKALMLAVRRGYIKKKGGETW